MRQSHAPLPLPTCIMPLSLKVAYSRVVIDEVLYHCRLLSHNSGTSENSVPLEFFTLSITITRETSQYKFMQSCRSPTLLYADFNTHILTRLELPPQIKFLKPFYICSQTVMQAVIMFFSLAMQRSGILCISNC